MAAAGAAAGAGAGAAWTTLVIVSGLRGSGRGGLGREPDDAEGRRHRVVDGGRRDGDGLTGDLRQSVETGAPAAVVTPESSWAGAAEAGSANVATRPPEATATAETFTAG